MIPIRQYNRILAGHNEEGGYTKPLLTYGASSRQFHFYTDAQNIFEYPPTSVSGTPVSASSFIDSGAFAGAQPLYSDYIRFAPNCEILDQNSMRDDFGQYLCTWLYKPTLAASATPIWIDRWYDPFDVTEEAAFAIGLSADSIIKDEVSILSLASGVDYDYFRFGNYTNQTILSTISSDRSLLLHVDDWNESIVNIEGGSINNDPSHRVNRNVPLVEAPADIIVDANVNVRRNNSKTRNDPVLDIRGNAHAFTDFDSSLIDNNQFSVCLWAKTEDWRDSNQKHILSNGFRGGWNMMVNTGFYNPMVSFFTTTSSFSLFFTNEGKMFFELGQDTREDDFGTYNLNHTISTVDAFVVDDDMYAYAQGASISSVESIFKVDILNGVIVSSATTSSSSSGPMKLDEDKNLHIYDDTLGLSFIHDRGLQFVSSSAPDYELEVTTATYFDINSLNETITHDMQFALDNDDNVWEIGSDMGIYRREFSGTAYGTAASVYSVSAEDIKFAHDERLWAITNDGSRKLAIYDLSNMQFVIDNTEISFLSTKISENELDFLSASYQFDLFSYGNEVRGFLLDLENNKAFIIDSTGKVIKARKYNLPTSAALAQSSPTTYEWHRKFSYLKNNKVPAVEMNITGKSVLSADPVETTLSVPASNLVDNEWHHFALTVTNSAANLYMDTVLLSSVSSANINNIYNIYETPLIIGTATSKSSILSRELTLDNYGFFDGHIDDLRYYGGVLTQSEIERIYTHKFRYEDMVLDLVYGDMHYYVEEVERFFKMKLPGSKSTFFNIKISGFSTSSQETKTTIENIIKNTITKISPAYTELYEITWTD